MTSRAKFIKIANKPLTISPLNTSVVHIEKCGGTRIKDMLSTNGILVDPLTKVAVSIIILLVCLVKYA